jgi:hypothetical protein
MTRGAATRIRQASQHLAMQLAQLSLASRELSTSSSESLARSFPTHSLGSGPGPLEYVEQGLGANGGIKLSCLASVGVKPMTETPPGTGLCHTASYAGAFFTQSGNSPNPTSSPSQTLQPATCKPAVQTAHILLIVVGLPSSIPTTHIKMVSRRLPALTHILAQLHGCALHSIRSAGRFGPLLMVRRKVRPSSPSSSRVFSR